MEKGNKIHLCLLMVMMLVVLTVIANNDENNKISQKIRERGKFPPVKILMLIVTTKERKMLLPSLRISSSITLQFLFVKSHRWISNRFVVYVFVINFAITFFPVVCLSHLCPIQRWSSITAKLEISAKSWLPSKSQFRSWSGVWPAPKMEFFRERKMLNGEVSALHAAVDEVIKFVAWHWAPSPWHLVSIEFPPINISLCFLKTKS